MISLLSYDMFRPYGATIIRYEYHNYKGKQVLRRRLNLASQDFSINRYKNIKEKALKCNTNIYFNKQCLKEGNVVVFVCID